ncbi:hypothetical protein GCM10022222_05610 [Amycolatopsis ultiminotia]|uniref:Uncharacterized protein n=1 Tax=Amycolatopsis ultiminotia TaxID=543629 RepID=A0ABP6V3N1_9PSEU
MTTAQQRGATAEAGDRSAARLEMKRTGAEPGHVDGGWWPHSTDLVAELPALAAALEHRLGPVSRVTYHLDTWAPAERKVREGDRTVRLEGFRATDPHTIMVLGADSRRVSLLVVPPEVSESTARAVLLGAADATTATVAEILAGNGVPEWR